MHCLWDLVVAGLRWFAASGIVGLLGVLLGAWLANFASRERERKNRASEFVGYLLYFRHLIARQGSRSDDAIWDAYLKGVFDYHRELGKIRRDFLTDARFLELTDDLGNIQRFEISEWKKTPDLRDVICDKIDVLGRMLEKRGGGWREAKKFD